jgi:hypothetical protein
LIKQFSRLGSREARKLGCYEAGRLGSKDLAHSFQLIAHRKERGCEAGKLGCYEAGKQEIWKAHRR